MLLSKYIGQNHSTDNIISYDVYFCAAESPLLFQKHETDKTYQAILSMFCWKACYFGLPRFYAL